MTYRILVEKNRAGGFQATALDLPEIRVVAGSREQALAELRATLAERFSTAEIVELEIPQASPQKEHSWKRFAGVFEDEPLFDEVQEAIEADRRADGEDNAV